MYSVPILLVGFNRPEIIQQALESILLISPKKIYVSIDGPRSNVEEDHIKVDDVINIIEKNKGKNIEFVTRYLDKNVGAEVNVSSAISWVFQYEKELIIFEDDIVVDKVFFEFTRDMLIKYRDNKEIYMISGCNFSDDVMTYTTDYVFSKYGHTLGWAIWKDRWDNYDMNIIVNPTISSIFKMKRNYDTWTQTLYHYRKNRNMKLKGSGNNSWDACLSYIMRSKGLLSIVPSKNLSKNIGVYGLHSNGITYHHRRTYPNFNYETHPKIIERNKEYDKIHYRNHFKNDYPFWKALKNLVSNILHKK